MQYKGSIEVERPLGDPITGVTIVAFDHDYGKSLPEATLLSLINFFFSLFRSRNQLDASLHTALRCISGAVRVVLDAVFASLYSCHWSTSLRKSKSFSNSQVQPHLLSNLPFTCVVDCTWFSRCLSADFPCQDHPKGKADGFCVEEEELEGCQS